MSVRMKAFEAAANLRRMFGHAAVASSTRYDIETRTRRMDQALEESEQLNAKVHEILQDAVRSLKEDSDGLSGSGS